MSLCEPFAGHAGPQGGSEWTWAGQGQVGMTALDRLLPSAREVRLFLCKTSGWLQGPWAGGAGFSGALAGSSLASQGKDKFLVAAGCFLVRGHGGFERCPRALGSPSGQAEGEDKAGAQQGWLREEEPAVTSRKPPVSGRREGQSGWSLRPAYPAPPFCLGVCPGSSEHRTYSKCCHQWKLSEGARKRARGRGQDSRPPVPVLPTPPSLMCCFILPFGKERGCPLSGMCPETTEW